MSPITAAGSRVAAARGFSTSARMANNTSAAALPASKPVGAIRSGVTGFLAGTVFAGFAGYKFVSGEFKQQNDKLLEDLYNLQGSVKRVANHLQALEEKVEAIEKKK